MISNFLKNAPWTLKICIMVNPIQSLSQILGGLESQDNWKGRQQLQQVLSLWAAAVGEAVAAQTRPTGIQRRVLLVATSSSAWAQNLGFERVRILEKLNGMSSLRLTDIRFSTGQWRSEYSIIAANISESAILWRDHPSRVGDLPLPQVKPAPDSQSAFRDWARTMRSRSQGLPLCPKCQCPSPPGELSRWGMCSLCAAQRFGREP
jgi:predicted nucleic acid-binding Zn ribbon protein